ncbi:LysR family transcriptional regulator [Paenilisteria rocourtiae]|uniref:DNA-binding transcriptional LysR family regulator n=1 Tax=Listeria rocourtiae TaxID=647910 RepID=A0A4R6ZJV8_9LIST|nr:LysR family transcriptional regulator [Listeria rocourtiae]MBC1604564.1 LysR family transcriptional regulator [Listeria rocourtiae]TDR52613.1 DNA-binding transcriptional LysR family regulator [Listeria rocourtiae]
MFKLLKTFITVYDEKNFTKASQQLYISQSAVSTQISSLEKLLGVSLFERSKYTRISPTVAGQFFYIELKKLQSEWKETVHTLHKLEKEENHTFKIGASETIGNTIVPELLSRLAGIFPHTRFEFSIANSSEIAKSISLSDINIGLVESKTSTTALESQIFMHDEMVVVGNPQDNVWLFHSEEDSVRQYTNQYLTRNRIKPEATLTCNNNSTILKMIQQGMGQTILSTLSIQSEQRILRRANFFRPLYMISSNTDTLVDSKIKNTVFSLLMSNQKKYA